MTCSASVETAKSAEETLPVHYESMFFLGEHGYLSWEVKIVLLGKEPGLRMGNA